MSLRIAFCGPNPDLNDELMHHVKDLIGNEVVDVTILPNAVREVMDISKKEHWKGYDIDWLNLWSTSYRGLLQAAAFEDDLVLSSSCNVDQVILQAAWLADQESHIEKTLLLVDNATGEVSAQDEAMIHRCGSALQVMLNQTEEDVGDYWDFIYAVMPVDIEVSTAPDIVLSQYRDFLSGVPIFRKKITILPDNADAAKDALEQEIEAWKTKLTNS